MMRMSEQGNLGSITYIQARKQSNGKFRLFYVGTENEIFPGEEFKSAHEARNFFKVMKIKRGEQI